MLIPISKDKVALIACEKQELKVYRCFYGSRLIHYSSFQYFTNA